MFDQSLAFGKIGEGYIASWLKHVCKFEVLPVYEKEIHEGKGPTLFTHTGEPLIAPDIFAFRRNPNSIAVRWIEAKTKSAFSWHRISQQWVTGIDKRHYEHYLKISEISPWPVWLMFLHLDGRAKDTPPDKTSPQGLFGNTLDYLREHINHISNNWANGMVYWAHNDLQYLASLEQIYKAKQSVSLMQP